MFGVCALLSLLLVRPAFILSLPAIIFGHCAKANLRRQKGELAGWGKARIGELLGYFCLLASVLSYFHLDGYRLLVRGAMESERTQSVNAHIQFDDGRLGAVEKRLVDGDTTDFGNNEYASSLSANFRRQLRSSLNLVLTRRGEKGLGLETSGISCYCHVLDSVCFIAAIPDLNGYNGAADDVLKKAAWQSAVLAITQTPETKPQMHGPTRDAMRVPNNGTRHGQKLAVGLMERSSVQTVLVGWVDLQPDGVKAPQRIENDGSVLVEFVNQ